MSYLLDTHVVLYWLADDKRLSKICQPPFALKGSSCSLCRAERAQLGGAMRAAPGPATPFDRLLAAQTKRRKLTLVTNDPMPAGFDIKTLW